MKIEDRLRLPALHTRRVSIPALDVAVAATVSSVRVFAGKLWVGVRAQVTNPGGARLRLAGEGLSVRRLLLAAGLVALGSAPHPAAPPRPPADARRSCAPSTRPCASGCRPRSTGTRWRRG